jgi:hypothetical protein
MSDDIRGRLGEALARRTRHPELEQTLFHRLQELETGPLEQLGELVRAVIDELRMTQHRLADQTRDLASLERTVATMTERLDALAARVEPPPAPPVDHGHLLLLPTAAGYRLVERPGAPPAAGERLDHEGVTFAALNHGASPLPADRRPCVLLLRPAPLAP